MAADPVFVDTNILVYATRPSAAQHAAAKAALTRLEGPCGSAPRCFASISRREPQATAPALPMATAIADVRRFRTTFDVAGEHAGVLDRLLNLLAGSRGAGRQVHDANIVATMLEQGIRRLLTFNAADFRRFGRIIDLEPLS